MRFGLDCECDCGTGTSTSTSTGTFGTTTCSKCGGSVATCWETAIAGMTSACAASGFAGNCDGWNRTLIMHAKGTCLWRKEIATLICNRGGNVVELGAPGFLFTDFGLSLKWTVVFYGQSGSPPAVDFRYVQYDFPDPQSGFNCLGANTLNRVVGSVNPYCVGWPSSIVIQPAHCPLGTGT